jgi:hypothetical protein
MFLSGLCGCLKDLDVVAAHVGGWYSHTDVEVALGFQCFNRSNHFLKRLKHFAFHIISLSYACHVEQKNAGEDDCLLGCGSV